MHGVRWSMQATELFTRVLHHRPELTLLHSLLLHEEVCQRLQERPLRHQDLVGPLMGLGDQGVHLAVDVGAGFSADLAMRSQSILSTRPMKKRQRKKRTTIGTT